MCIDIISEPTDSYCLITSCSAPSPSLLSNRYRGLFPEGGGEGDREADNSPLPNVEVKNSGATPPLSHTSSRRGP
jgi:hypothetical protein